LENQADTADMQMVSLTLRVMSRPDTSQLSKIYQNLGQDYDERVLPSIGNEVLKATVAQFDGELKKACIAAKPKLTFSL
jgi:hypothetical protein